VASTSIIKNVALFAETGKKGDLGRMRAKMKGFILHRSRIRRHEGLGAASRRDANA